MWRGEEVPLLAKRLTGAHEGPGLVGGTTLLIQAHHALMTLVGREVGSWGFSRKESQLTLPGLVEARSWLGETHVALARKLLLLRRRLLLLLLQS